MSDLDSLRRRPASASTARASTGGSGGFMQVIVGMVMGIVLCVAVQQYVPDFIHDGGGDRQDHRHEQAEPVSGGTLVFVCDKQLPTADQDQLMRQMPEFIKANGVEFLWLDDEDPTGKKLLAHAESKGITGPTVGYVKDKSIKRVAAWPVDLKAVEAFLK